MFSRSDFRMKRIENMCLRSHGQPNIVFLTAQQQLLRCHINSPSVANAKTNTNQNMTEASRTTSIAAEVCHNSECRQRRLHRHCRGTSSGHFGDINIRAHATGKPPYGHGSHDIPRNWVLCKTIIHILLSIQRIDIHVALINAHNYLVSLNRLSLGCENSPRRQSGDITGV